MPNDKIRVLIADDSALMRREIKRIIESDPDLEVIAAARNGQDALEKTIELQPDVVALDINMPVMDGLTALQRIMMQAPRPVVMISSLTQEGARITYEALELGAVDFVGKPDGTISLNIDKVAHDIIYKIKAAARSNRSRLRLRRQKLPLVSRKESFAVSRRRTPKSDFDKIVVIGQSTGGPNTIMDILPLIPEDFEAPILLVQHMPGTFTPSFAQRLDKNCAIRVKEAQSGDIIKPGWGYLAPGDIHMTIAPRGMGNPGFIIRLSKTPSDTLHMPSVDVTMMSVVKYLGNQTIGVLLTGMGDDGADAMVHIRRAGGRTIAESEETAVVFGMPREAIARGGAEFVLPSYSIAEKIIELVRS